MTPGGVAGMKLAPGRRGAQREAALGTSVRSCVLSKTVRGVLCWTASLMYRELRDGYRQIAACDPQKKKRQHLKLQLSR